MAEEFVLLKVVDGVEKKRCVFSRVELKHVKDGVFYAKEKDYLLRRKHVLDVVGKRIGGLLG